MSEQRIIYFHGGEILWRMQEATNVMRRALEDLADCSLALATAQTSGDHELRQAQASSDAWLSVRAAAKTCSLSSATLYRAISAGDLPVSRIGERQIIRISAGDLRRWMERQA